MKNLIKLTSAAFLVVLSVLVLPTKGYSQYSTVFFQAEIPNSSTPYVTIGNQEYIGTVSVSGYLVSPYEFHWDGGQGTILLYNESKTLVDITVRVYPWIGTNDDGSKFITVEVKDNDTGQWSQDISVILIE